MSESKKNDTLEEFEFPMEQANAATYGMRVNVGFAIIE